MYLPEQAARGVHGMVWEPEPWVGFTMRGERDSSHDGYGGQVWGPVWSPPIGPDTLAEVVRLRAEVERLTAAVEANTAARLLGPMARRIGQLGIALRRLADVVDQECPKPTRAVRERLVRAREVIADNTILAEPDPATRTEWGMAYGDEADPNDRVSSSEEMARQHFEYAQRAPHMNGRLFRREVSTGPWREIPAPITTETEEIR